MDIYASDEEKGEEIKQWWRDNGGSVFLGIVLAAALVFGGRYWMGQKQVQMTNASNHYQHVQVLLAENKFTEAEPTVDLLFSEFAKTPYAVFAAFDLAKYSAEKGDFTTTKSYLEWVIAHSKLTAQIETARLRLAKLLLNEGKYQQALEQVEQAQSAAFESLFEELKGDIYQAQGIEPQAKSTYQTVLNSLEESDPRYMIVKLKLDDVSGSKD